MQSYFAFPTLCIIFMLIQLGQILFWLRCVVIWRIIVCIVSKKRKIYIHYSTTHSCSIFFFKENFVLLYFSIQNFLTPLTNKNNISYKKQKSKCIHYSVYTNINVSCYLFFNTFWLLSEIWHLVPSLLLTDHPWN